ncbi:MAG TPA: MBL fold metallo-hydrolase [Candidatus Binataceae bacterium]|nr:MBL fold metallo-hydrolase [Candidatus Binataceae bacterium]
MADTPPSIEIGAFKIAFLTDGLWRNDGGCMFGVVPRELWKQNHPPDERNRIRLNLTCPLIVRGSDAILVDTGIGNRLDSVERKIFDHGQGWLPDHLRALGMELGDVTAVIVSHLHFDHCGGLVRRRESGTLEAAFPRAKIFVQKGELEVARDPRNERLHAAYRHALEIIEPNKARLEAIEGTLEIASGVTAIPTGGHTRDHQIARVTDGASSFIHLADIVPTRSHMRGPWNQAYDLDALVTMDQKARYLSQAVENRTWVSFAHDDEVFAAQVNNDRGRLVLIQKIVVPKNLAA